MRRGDVTVAQHSTATYASPEAAKKAFERLRITFFGDGCRED